MFGNGQHATIRRSMGERGGGDLPAHNSDRSSFVACTARSAHLDRLLLGRRCLPAHHSWTGVVDGSRSCSRKWRLEGRIPSRKCCDHNHGGGAGFRDLDFERRHLKSAMGRNQSSPSAPQAVTPAAQGAIRGPDAVRVGSDGKHHPSGFRVRCAPRNDGRRRRKRSLTPPFSSPCASRGGFLRRWPWR